MAQIKLFRGSQEASLPNNINDGAIYIITNEQGNGDLYTDIDGNRVKIGSDFTGGTAGYPLVGNGTTSAPVWQAGYYGNCTTAAATAEKTVSLTNFKRCNGCSIYVRFANANTAAAPTLNIQSTGAASMYYNGEVITSDNFTFDTSTVYHFIYASPTGSSPYYWILVGMSQAVSAAKEEIAISSTEPTDDNIKI